MTEIFTKIYPYPQMSFDEEKSIIFFISIKICFILEMFILMIYKLIIWILTLVPTIILMTFQIYKAIMNHLPHSENGTVI